MVASCLAAQTATNITSTCTPNVVYGWNAGAIPATNTAAGGSSNLRWNGLAGQDQLFANWWYYRVAGDTREFSFSRAATSGIQNPAAPIVVGPKGDTGIIEWVNLDGKGIDARLVTRVYSTASAAAPTGGVCSQCMEIRNPTTTAVVINLFHYADFDVCASAGGDSAAFVGPPQQIQVTDPACAVRAFHLACRNQNYLTAPFGAASAQSLLTNAVIDNLTNVGIPFGPGDWTNGYQWQDITIPPGRSLRFYIGLSCDREIPCCDPATIENYCVGKPGSNGIPAWGQNPLYVCGQTELKVLNVRPGSPPIVLLGANPTTVCIPLAPFGSIAVLPIITTFGMPPANANGVSGFCLEVPWNPGLCGAMINLQAFIPDPGAAGGIAHTDGCKFTIGSL
jgi:hypothetical protein